MEVGHADAGTGRGNCRVVFVWLRCAREWRDARESHGPDGRGAEPAPREREVFRSGSEDDHRRGLWGSRGFGAGFAVAALRLPLWMVVGKLKQKAGRSVCYPAFQIFYFSVLSLTLCMMN